MKKVLMSVTEVSALIQSGKALALAGDESLLAQLPQGNWIGGTIPYFVGENGGVQSRELIYVSELEGEISATSVRTYSTGTISRIAADAPDNGYSVLIIPALTPIHVQYAKEARDYQDMFLKPVIGWIAGVHLDDLGKVTPKVFNGQTGEILSEAAVALHAALPEDCIATIEILNLFRQGRGDVLTFPETGFSAATCRVNGKETSFADYVNQNKLDLALPLVADYNGAQINTSFQGIEGQQVNFYAPVFAGMEYRQAAPVGDYVHEFEALSQGQHEGTPFACNCILNYLYGKLEGRKTGDLTGPITFGEIGYQLLNQTQVILKIVRQ